MRVVALAAAAGGERLAKVRFLEGSFRGIVTSKAEAWLRRGQVEGALRAACGLVLVRGGQVPQPMSTAACWTGFWT